MRNPITTRILPLLGLTALMAACTGNGNSPASRSDVTNFKIDQTLKVSERYYRYNMDMGGDSLSGYAFISATIMWPENVGDANLGPLQDSILVRAFPRVVAGADGVDAAITKFVADTAAYEFVCTKWSDVDSLPDNDAGRGAYYIDVTTRMPVINDRYVTCEILNSSFMGGAHPYTAEQVFSYDLKNAVVLTADNMFVKGSRDAVLAKVKEALARDLNTSVDKLAEAGIFVDQMTTLGSPSLNNGAVVFHYNAYDIAPYSAGDFDINVWPYEIEQYLTPEVKQLLD